MYRYGNIFKTHILGYPTIISMDPEFNRYILMNEAKGLIPSYPDSMINTLGKHNIGAISGPIHKHIRGSFLSLVSPPVIRSSLFPTIDKSVRVMINKWADRTIDIQKEANDVSVHTSVSSPVTSRSHNITCVSLQCVTTLHYVIPCNMFYFKRN